MEKINMFAYFPKIYTLYFILIAVGVFLICIFLQSILVKRLYNMWDGLDGIETEIPAKFIGVEKKSFARVFNISYYALFSTDEGNNITLRLNKHDIRFMNAEEGAYGKLIYKNSAFVGFEEYKDEEENLQ